MTRPTVQLFLRILPGGWSSISMTFRPSRSTFPYFPCSICQLAFAVHQPYVGSCAKLHGQPTLQLQLSTMTPDKFQLSADIVCTAGEVLYKLAFALELIPKLA